MNLITSTTFIELSVLFLLGFLHIVIVLLGAYQCKIDWTSDGKLLLWYTSGNNPKTKERKFYVIYKKPQKGFFNL